TVLDEDTEASIGTGATLDATGAVTVSAGSESTNLAEAIGSVDATNKGSFAGKGSSTSTTSSSNAQGSGSSGGASGAGIGGSLALITGTGLFTAATGTNQVTSSTTATLARDVDASGTVNVAATGQHSYDAEATAMAGGTSSSQGGASDGQKSASENTLASSEAQGSMGQSQQAMDTNKGASSGNSSGAQGSKLSVAAALGAALVGDTVTATIAGGPSSAAPRSITAGAVNVSATSNGDVLTIGDGSTVAKSNAGVGIGAAIGVMANTTTATVGDDVAIKTPGTVTVAATSTENRDAGFADRLAAQAMSGATGKNLAVAGSLAIVLSDSTTSASLGDNVTVSQAGGGLAGTLGVTADNTSSLSAKAWGGSYSANGTGIGASIAAAIALDTYSATAGTNDTLDASAVTVTATNEKVSAPPQLNLASDADLGGLEGDITSGGFSADKSKMAKVKADLTGSLQAVGTDAETHALLGENNYYTEVLAGAASGSKLAIAGGFALQVIDNTVKAEIGAGTTIDATGAVKVAAEDDTQSKALVGSLAASGGSTGIGVSSAIVADTSNVTSSLDGAVSITHSGTVSVLAGSSQNFGLFEVSAGIADTTGVAGVLGAVASNVTTSATVGAGSNLQSAGLVDVAATNGISTLNLGGGIVGGGTNAVGGTAMVTVVLNTTSATVASANGTQTVIDAGAISVNADFNDTVIALAVGGGAAGTTAVVGAATPVTQDATVTASVGDWATLSAASGDLGVTAQDSAKYYNIGFVVDVGGTTGVGGAAAVSTFADTTRATVGTNATLDATGALTVSALASEAVTDVVVSGGAAGENAVNVSLASSIVTDTTEAFIADTATVGSINQPTLLTIAATDTTSILDLDGSLGFGGTAGVGAAADVNVLVKHTHAWLGQSSSTEPTAVQASTVHAGSVVVDAETSQSTNSVVVGVTAGGDAGVAGSAAVYSLTGDTVAGLADDATVDATGNVAVLANNANSLNRLVGGAAFGGTAGIGAAVNVTVDLQTTLASIGDDTTIVALGQGDGISATTGYSAVFGAYGADNTVPTATTSGSDSSHMKTVATTDSNGNPIVLAEGTPVSVADGITEGAELFALQRTLTPTTTTVHGVVVNATNHDAIRSVAVSGAIGGDVSVTLSGDVPVIVSDTEATVGANASINATGTGTAAQSVTVAAASDLYHLGIAGSAGASGTVGAGAGAEISYVQNTTKATVAASVTDPLHVAAIDAVRNVSVTARASEDVAGAAATAAGGGEVGVAGGVTGFAVNDQTLATIGNNDTVKAGGNVIVAADDQTRSVVVAGALAVGIGTAGVGGSVGVGIAIKDTEATIGTGAEITALGNGDLPGDINKFASSTGADFTTTDGASRGLLVSANSGESFDTVVLAGAGGLFAGVAGDVSVEVVAATTKASIGGSTTVNADNAGANAAEGVNVTARDSTVLATVDGAAGLGIAGVAGSLDLAVIANTTQAFIGDGATVNAKGDVLVNALDNVATSSTVASLAGGLGGAAGAFALLAVADGPNADQTTDTSNSRGSMTDYASDQMSNDKVTGFLSGSANSNVSGVSAAAQARKSTITTALPATTLPPGTSATIGQATITADGTVGVHSLSQMSTDLNAGGLDLSAGAGAGVGVTAIQVNNAAKIATGSIVNAGAVDVGATTTRNAVGVAVSAAAAGVAGSAASFGDGSTTSAELGGSVTTAGTTAVAAASSADVVLTSGTAANGAGLGLNVVALTPSTTATIDGTGTSIHAGMSQAGDVTLSASATQLIDTGVASAATSLGGAAINVVVLTPTTTATIADGSIVKAGATDGSTDGNIVISAMATQTLENADVGLAIAGLGAGSLSVYTVTGSTTAHVGDATLVATANVGVLANDYTAGDVLVGAAGLGSDIGASIGVSIVDTTTAATVANNAAITAYALDSVGLGYVASYGSDFSPYGSGDKVKAGTFDGNVTGGSGNADSPSTTGDVITAGLDLLTEDRDLSNPAKTVGHGVIVNAANADAIRTVTVGGAISAGSLAMSATVPVILTTTTATIGTGVQINQATGVTANGRQSVTVAATNAVYDLNVAGSAAGGLAAGIGAGVSVDVVHGDTTATIGQNSKVAAKDDVTVSALATEDFASMAASAGAGGVGLAGAVSVISLDDTTEALIDQGAQVTAQNNVAVLADDESRTATVAGAIGLGAGAAIGGSIGVSVLTKDTEAHIAANAKVSGLARGSDQFNEYTGDSYSAAQNGQGVLVQANSNQSELVVDAAGSLAGFVGAAGAISVQVINVTTLAAVDELATINNATGASSNQDLVVTARDSTGLVAFDGDVAGGGVAGIGGSVDVGVVNTTVGASIGNGATVNAANDLIVDAIANKAISSTVGSASGAGLGALAAAVSVYSIGDGIDPSSKGGQELQPSSGSSVGSYATSQLNGSSSASSQIASGIDGATNNADAQGAGTSLSTRLGSLDFNAAITSPSTAGTSAVIGSANINKQGQARGSVKVATADIVTANTTVGAAAVAGGVSLGAGVGVITDSATNTASIAGPATVTPNVADAANVTSGSISVNAATDHTMAVTSAAGSAALGAALEADVAIVRDSSATSASLNGGIFNAGSIGVDASSERTLTAHALGGAAAVDLAVGVSSATADVAGSVSANLGKDVGGTGVSLDPTTAGTSVSVLATSTDSASADAKGASGGLGGAGEGAIASATVAPTVMVTADDATIDADTITIKGQATDQAVAMAYGIALAGGLAVGASEASATVQPDVQVEVTDGSILRGGAVTVEADVLDPSGHAADAEAAGSSGAFVGINATQAQAINASTALALVSGSSVDVTGLVSVLSTITTDQYATASGNVGGIVAVGANTSSANSDSNGSAELVGLTRFSSGSLTLQATGTDTNTAFATSGSGGVVAGAAASASTDSEGTIQAFADPTSNGTAISLDVLQGTDPTRGAVTIAATHTANFSGGVNSTQAAGIGVSGSTLVNTVNSTVDAHLGAGMGLDAIDFTLDARNLVSNLYLASTVNDGWNIEAGSGGIINAPAGSSTTNVSQTTTATIGNNASVHLLAPSTGVSSLFVEAFNSTTVQQQAQISAASGIAIAEADTIINVNSNLAAVTFGTGSKAIVDIGDIEADAWDAADLEGTAVSTTYGLAGAPTGKAHATLNSANTITVGTNALIEASDGVDPTDGVTTPTHGTVTLAAGEGHANSQSALAAGAITIDTTVDLYNNTAIPIPSTPDAYSSASNTSTVTIGSDTLAYQPGITGSAQTVYDPTTDVHRGVNAAGDITVVADKGALSLNATGTGKNIYLEGLSDVASAMSEAFGSGPITFDITGGSTSQAGSQGKVDLEGFVQTGLEKAKALTISYADGAVTGHDVTLAGNMNATVSAAPVQVGEDILSRILQLQTLETQYGSDLIAKGAYQAELKFLYAEAVGMGLGTVTNGVFTQNNQVTAPTNNTTAQATLKTDQTTASTDQTSFNTAMQLAPTTTGVAYANNIADDVDAGTYGIQSTVGLTLTQLQMLSGYGNAYKNNGAVSLAVSDISNQQTTIATTLSQIKTATSAITSDQSDIAAQTKTIIANQNTLIQDGISGKDKTAATNAIASAQVAIKNDLQDISTQSGNLTTLVASLQTATTAISTDFGTIQTASQSTDPSSSNTGADTTIINNLTAYTAPSDSTPASYGYLAGFNHAVSDISTQNASLATSITTTTNQVTLLLSTPTTAPSTTLNTDNTGQNSLSQWVSLLGKDGKTVVTDTEAVNAPPSNGSLQTYQVMVADTATRLGNISFVADTMTGSGTGQVHAPGDASITIINKTADELYLGNLSNPSYEAGRVRFNGVLTNTAGDVNKLDGGSLALASMITSTGAVPTVTVESLYNPGDLTFANSTPSQAARVAPDIVLDTGKVINNLAGSVTITSAAGNIFIRGGTSSSPAINAGSVDIEAKNGDFSTSYTDTIDHVGGDPASGSNTNPGITTGAGIIANGAVFISARYLDINSTIQSGIVDQTLQLSSTTALTAATLADIGRSDSATQIAADFNTAQSQNTTKYYLDASDDIWFDFSGGSASTAQIEFTQAYAETYVSTNNLTGSAANYLVVNPNNTVGATYNAASKVFSVDDTEVHGGSVTLYGQILNTSFQGTDNGQSYTSAGQINVLDGFGTINIQNTTGHAVVLQNLNTGADPTGTGRGTAGTIDITDVHQATDGRGVDFTETVYTRSYTPGASGDGTLNVSATSWEVFNDGKTGASSTATSTVTGRSTSYDPLAGERYVWQTGTNYATTTTFSHTEDEIFGNDNWSFNDVTQLQNASTNVTSQYQLPNGSYVSTGSTQNDNTSVNHGTNGIIISTSASSVSNTAASTESKRLISSTDDYNTSPDAKPVKTGESSSCNWWTLCIDSKKTAYYTLNQTYTEIDTSSLKADNPIGIHFIGSNTGSISVASNSDIVIGGTVTNHAGTTTIKATGTANGSSSAPSSIIQGATAASVTSGSIDLEAAGSVGGVANSYGTGAANTAITVALAQTVAADKSLNAPTGTLTAKAANGNVDITSAGSLNLATVTAGGSVVNGTSTIAIYAGDGILAASNANLVQADKVTLTAANGGIGGSTALNVNTGYTDNQSLRPFGDPATDPNLPVNYGLTASASGSITISSTKWADNADGSMLVNQVISTGGDVTLSSTGHILDNNPDQTVDQKSYAALLGYWNSLGLLAGATNTAKVNQAITAYEQARTNDYSAYWKIRDSQPNGGATYDPNFVVTILPGTAQYQALADYYASQPSAETVAQRIADYAAAQTTAYHTLNAEVGGLTPANFQVTILPGTAEYQALATYYGAHPSSETVAQRIADQAAAETAAYRNQNTGSGGLPTAQIDPITKLPVTFQYVPTTSELAGLQANSTWSEKELALQLSAGALKTVTSTNTVVKAPNVAGNVVTLNANVGVGETEGTPTSPGIRIDWGTQISSLTDADKVALAAAERPDLTLTISGFGTLTPAQFAALTSDQQAAYTAAQAAWNAAGITGPVTIDLGTVDNTTQTVTPGLIQQRAALKAAAGGFVDATNSYLSILPKRPLNVAAFQSLNVDVPGTGAIDGQTGQTHPTIDNGNAYIASAGSLALGTISVADEARIKVTGSLSNATTSAINTGNIILEAAQGQIGNLASNTPLTLGTVGTITARALNGIDLFVDGDAAVDTIYSPGNIRLEAQNAITNANADLLINILGTNVTLVSDTGSIGAVPNRLNVGVNLNGGITATALSGSVDLYGPAGNSFVISNVTAGDTVDLDSAGDGTIDGTVKAAGNVTLNAGGKLGLTGRAAVNTAAGNVVITANTLKMLDGATIAPMVGTISIATTGNALVTGLSSANAAADAVSITASGFVLAGTDATRTADITASKGGVTIIAALGIGNATEADTELADLPTDVPGTADTITAVPNPLRINAAVLALTATAGDIDVETGVAVTTATLLAQSGNVAVTALDAFHAQSITTPLGSISVTGQQAITLDTLQAGTGANPTSGAITVLDEAGLLTIGTATSGGTQSYTARDGVSFTSLSSTGLANDAGAITVVSQTGTVDGTSLNSHGDATIDGVDLQLGQVISGGSADLEAGQTNNGGTVQATGGVKLMAGTELDWSTVEAGTDLDATVTAGPLTFGTATSGGTQTIVAQGNVGFGSLITTGILGDAGDIDVTSQQGLVKGTTLSANGSAAVHSVNLDIGAVTTGATADLEAAQTIQGTTLKTGTGATFLAGTSLDWTTIRTGTTLDATVTAGPLTFGTATSGGTQTIVAQGNIGFGSLITTGILGDAGDIDVTSQQGLVKGTTLS
ncbi:hypothetical protein, partial [Jatrophihabitans endophyticus]|uniref:hypothetical protein n=1 Tax=Jatrophihabitans endophyticus TaxID=1206085 RepID=UPI0019DB9A90